MESTRSEITFSYVSFSIVASFLSGRVAKGYIRGASNSEFEWWLALRYSRRRRRS